jgi:hypothetical protein
MVTKIGHVATPILKIPDAVDAIIINIHQLYYYMSYDRRDESIMNPSVSTGVESTNITRLRFQWHCRVRG